MRRKYLSPKEYAEWTAYKTVNNVDHSFTSDGCTCYQDKRYTIYCYMHDWEYMVGKSLKDKLVADLKLYKRVRSTGAKLDAIIMYVGVTLFGFYSFYKKG